MDAPLRKRVFRELLPFVEKPGRYIGNEINIIVKDPARVQVSWCLAFPDTYEIGMSHTGTQILYHILNSLDYVAAERTYAPWTDMDALMRERDIPLFTLENFRPVGTCDVLGFTLQSELNYTNILSMLDLAGLPVHAADRTDGMPLVVAGGPNAYNPGPLAAFVDAFAVGDGEATAPALAACIRDGKAAGLGRAALLQELSSVGGVYVPGVSEAPVKAVLVPELKRSYLPDRTLIPVSRILHDRLAVEIMRGCPHGCRFCSAGMLYRPVRERQADDILGVVDDELVRNGWDEVSLLSLSSSDYSRFDVLMGELGCRNAKVSVPSQRLDTFLKKTDAVRGVKRGGLTFAPEAGTDRLRRVINKSITDDELVAAAEKAFTGGWRLIKLYFMIGLPTETDDDLQGIVDLVKRMRAFTRTRRDLVKVTVSPFIPKPFTPFQWEPLVDERELHRRSVFIKDQLRGVRNVECSYRDTTLAAVEGLLSRGGDAEARVLYAAWRNGARFDGWTDRFSMDAWTRAIDETGLDTAVSLGAREPGTPLPWDSIDAGIGTAFLRKERERAYRAEMTPDCPGGTCRACGRCTDEVQMNASDGVSATRPAGDAAVPAAAGQQDSAPSFGRKKKRAVPVSGTAEILKRIRFSRGEEMMFVSHLDIIQVFQRCLKRTGVPVAYSQGMRPHQKLAFGLPLMVGATSTAEYLDVSLVPGFAGSLGAQLNEVLPAGIRVTDEKVMYSKPVSLNAAVNLVVYDVDISGLDGCETVVRKLADWEQQETMTVVTRKKGRDKEINLRPFLDDLEIINENGGTVLRLRINVDQTKGTVKPAEFIKWSLPGAELRALPVLRREQLVRDRTGRIRTLMEVV